MRWFLIMAVAVSAMATEVYDTPEGRWAGRWMEVAATAYTPTNAIDSAYHESKGTRWRWILADGKTHAKRTPYGIAVKLIEGRDGKWRPTLPFGTRVYIPTGYGYMDRSMPEERVFVVDDGSASSLYRSRISDLMHVDMRWIDTSEAVQWAGAEGHRVMRVFIIERELLRLVDPVVTWPAALVEFELPSIPPAAMNEPMPAGSGWLVGMFAILPFLLAGGGVVMGLRR